MEYKLEIKVLVVGEILEELTNGEKRFNKELNYGAVVDIYLTETEFFHGSKAVIYPSLSEKHSYRGVIQKDLSFKSESNTPVEIKQNLNNILSKALTEFGIFSVEEQNAREMLKMDAFYAALNKVIDITKLVQSSSRIPFEYFLKNKTSKIFITNVRGLDTRHASINEHLGMVKVYHAKDRIVFETGKTIVSYELDVPSIADDIVWFKDSKEPDGLFMVKLLFSHQTQLFLVDYDLEGLEKAKEKLEEVEAYFNTLRYFESNLFLKEIGKQLHHIEKILKKAKKENK